jgi:hypothetical protein
LLLILFTVLLSISASEEKESTRDRIQVFVGDTRFGLNNKKEVFVDEATMRCLFKFS